MGPADASPGVGGQAPQLATSFGLAGVFEEPIGCDEFAGDELAPVDAASMSDAAASRDDLGMDAADRESMDAVRPAASQETPMIGPSGNRGLAALDRWLQNIERRMVRRVQ